MKNTFKVAGLIALTIVLMAGTIDLENLFNYENQSIPAYIIQDNMPSNNQITDEGATLGRVLFYDKKLSTNNSIACASCHQQQFAFSDTAQFSQGVNNITFRHSMRLANIRFGEDDKFRWDKTADSLTTQMIKPITNFDEMGYSGENGAPSIDDLISELSNTTYYPILFNLAFGDSTITENRMARALAQFVMSIQSFDSKYDTGRAQVNSDTEDFPNFTTQENLGKQLFIDSFTVITDTITVIDAITGEEEMHAASRRISGGMNCASCHRPPEFDIDPNSLNNGFVRGNPAFGPGNDYTVFRTPTLRDMADPSGTLNGGMFHFGAATNINLIFAHYDFRQIDPNNPDLDPRYLPAGLPIWLDVTMQERQQMNAFLKTLTGNDVYTNEKWSDPFDENGEITILNGTTSTSDIHTEIDCIKLFPNPVINEFTISGELGEYSIQIFDSNGQLYHNINTTGSVYTIDVTTLPAGLYFVRVQNINNNLIEIEKIVKD